MRKRILCALLALMLVTALVGCNNGNSGGSSQSPQSDGTESSAPSNEGSERKDTIIFAQGSDITSLDPHIGKQLRAFTVTSNMFEQIVKFDENQEIAPSLAERWEQVSDTETRFFLRQDVKWHNGDGFTAEDVKFSYERMMANPNVANNIAFLESVEVEDEYTVVLTTKYPYAPLLASLTTPPCSIVPKAVVEADEDGFALDPIGTGPYKFKEWKPDEYCTIEAWEGYYGEPAQTRYITMKVIPEATQRTIMLETGEIDVAYDVSPNDVKRIEEADGLTLLQGPSMKTANLNMNYTSDGPLGNKLVRQAVAHAIDKEEIVIGVLDGIGQVGVLPVPPRAFGYDDSIPDLEFNPERAKELLAEAGYADGFSCTIWVDEDQIYTEICTVIQNQLAQVGINMQIEVMKQATKQNRLYEKQDFDMNMAYFNNIVGDADYNLYSNFAPESQSNHCYYDNPQVTDLVIKSREAFTDEDRTAIYTEIYNIIMDETPLITIFYEDMCVGINNKIEGFQLNVIGAHKYKNAIAYQ